MEDIDENIFFYNFQIEDNEEEKKKENDLKLHKKIASDKNREKYDKIYSERNKNIENKINNTDIKKWKKDLKKKKTENKKKRYKKMTSPERKIALSEKRKKNSKPEKEKLIKKLKKNLNKGLSIKIDLYYTEKMSLKECNSLGSQISQCYSITKKSKIPINLGLINYTSKIKQILSKNFFSENWIINIHKTDITELKKKKKIIYLSPDSEKILKEVNEDFIFIIGGLVDGQVIKDCSKYRARDLEVECMKLPLREAGLDLSIMRSVLNVNLVFDMLFKGYLFKDLTKGIRMSVSEKYLLKEV